VTLKVHTEENDQREVTMTVEVAEERVESAMRQKARQLAREVNIPGFRRGKAPYQVIVRRIGRDVLRSEAIEEMVGKLFEEALDQSELEQEALFARPSLDDMDEEPLVLKFTLPLQPVATFGDYRSLRREIEPVVITEEAVDEALERIRARLAEVEEVERPTEAGDVVTIGGIGRLQPKPVEADETAVEGDDPETAESEAEILFDQDRLNIILDSEKTFPNTPFVDNLLGLNVGDDATFIFTFPEDYDDEELAGREAQIEVSVLKVQRRDLPELDDELAQKENEETLADLREKLRQDLQQEAEEAAKNELIEYMVDELRKEAILAYPPAAVAEEVENSVESIKQQATRSGWEWADFLMIRGETEDSLREAIHDAAVERVEKRIVFMELLSQEKIRITAEDIDAALDEQLSKYEDERLREGMREYFLQGEGISNLTAELINDKLHERIEAILTGTAPDLSELEVIPLEDEEDEEE
jgi:trigger factor